MKDDLWCLWPDGFMCQKHEVEDWLCYRSDDYEVVKVLRYNQYGDPCDWIPKK